MRQIKAFLRPQMLDAVVDAIESFPGAPGLTVSTVRGFGHRDSGGPAELTERVKLELVATDEMVDALLPVILEHSRTGHPGDGKIFIAEVVDCLRVRTGETGDAALRTPSASSETS
ncbi:MAG: P-II family nitrogen regulator [Gemmatimonadales bacterium]